MSRDWTDYNAHPEHLGTDATERLAETYNRVQADALSAWASGRSSAPDDSTIDTYIDDHWIEWLGRAIAADADDR